MSESRESNSKIKIHHFPLALQINPSLGLLNFPSESESIVLEKPIISLTPHQQDITFKSALARQENSDEQDDDDFSRKKTVLINKIIIKPQNLKKKYFRVDIPVNRAGNLSNRNRQKVHFVIRFGNENKGSLSILDDIYDCQMEINNNIENAMTFDEKMKAQDAKLDARRREEKVEILEQKKEARKKQK